MRRLFEEFPPVSTADWRAVVEKDLKGADFEKKLVSKTEDGIAVRPIYRTEDRPAATAEARAGQAPFVRGYQAAGNPWRNREEVRETSVTKANAHARRALERGADEIAFVTFPFGVQVQTADDVRRLLDGIDLARVPVFFYSGPYSPILLAMLLAEAERQGLAVGQLRGGLDFDPLTDGVAGYREGGPDEWLAEAKAVVKLDIERLPAIRTLSIRAGQYHEAGASHAQELAIAIALLTEYLVALKRHELEPARVVAQTEIRLEVGSQYFLEIAKLRAAKDLVSRVLAGFGVTEARPRLHASTTLTNKTVYDPYNNLLRATTEAMSMAIGGVDSMSVTPFDEAMHLPDEFGEHLARNTETLLKSEAYFTKVADPLGGAYAVEALTDSLAKAAWTLFQRIEADGGFLAAWQNGWLREDVERVRAAKRKLVNQRRTPLVGTSVYANPKEQRLGDLLPELPAPAKAVGIGEAFAEVQGMVREGAKLEDWSSENTPADSPLRPLRLANPFEQLRLAVERHVAHGGRRPRVDLVLSGSAAMRKARAMFALGLFAAGGYDVVEHPAVDDFAQVTKDTFGTSFLVLCSSDDEYPLLLPALREHLDIEIPIVIAGYPEALIEQLKSQGAVDFIHARQDAVEVLTAYHGRLGIPL